MILFQAVLLCRLVRCKEDCPCHRDERNHWWFSFVKSQDMLMASTDETVIFVATNFPKVIIFAIQNKCVYRVLIFYLQDKRFLWWGQQYRCHCVFVTWWHEYGMAKHLVILLTCFMCLTHPWRMGLERFLIEFVELNTLNDCTFLWISTA